jgi:nucleotide sugar dehydrogenase
MSEVIEQPLDAHEIKQRFAARGGVRPIVCVQGLGFVGAAMAAAVARARGENGELVFDVVGVDRPGPDGEARIEAVNRGRFPFATTDPDVIDAVKRGAEAGNLVGTSDDAVYGLASVILVDVNFDIDWSGDQPRFAMDKFTEALRSIGRNMREDALVIVETTVPPGTCAKVVAPALERHLRDRGLPADRFLLAHAYERVMPGDRYLDSIVNFWRVFSGHTEGAADACEAFLGAVVNTREFPLRRLGSTTASETAKVLENSYRAVTIALMDEWGRFAETAGIDLFEIVSAIRVRPTHSNMRTPGLGVGGYCLTKDPLFAEVAARDLFDAPDVRLPFSSQAVDVNSAMPLRALARLKELIGPLAGRRILLLGLAYRPDVGDTRSSPSLDFWRAAEDDGATVLAHDPLVARGPETRGADVSEMPSSAQIDAIVFAVDHRFYAEFDFAEWLGGRRPFVFDANGVLGSKRRSALRALGCAVASVGCGE